MAIPHYFTRESGGFLPNGLSRSPWRSDVVAGGPVAALVGTLIDEADFPADLDIVRISVDILGLVPRKLLKPRITAIKSGRQTQLHTIDLLADDQKVVQAKILLARCADTPPSLPLFDYPQPEQVTEDPEFIASAAMAGAVRARPIMGRIGEPGRGIAWLSMNGEIVSGTTPSIFAKACMFSDFGNGVGSATKIDEWSFANLDIDISFLRRPSGDWLLIDAETTSAGTGHAVALSTFADCTGIYAFGTQSVFVAPALR